MKYRVREGVEVNVHKTLPKGWRVLKEAMTQPVGTVWIQNNEPLFVKGKDGKMHKNPKAKQALCVQNEDLMIVRIAEKRRYEKKGADNFTLDKRMEERVRAEMNRQTRAQRKWERERETRMKAVAKENARKSTATKKSTAKKAAKKK